MSISDTCSCGASLCIAHTLISSERDDHERWLAAHTVCRTPALDDLRRENHEGDERIKEGIERVRRDNLTTEDKPGITTSAAKQIRGTMP